MLVQYGDLIKRTWSTARNRQGDWLVLLYNFHSAPKHTQMWECLLDLLSLLFRIDDDEFAKPICLAPFGPAYGWNVVCWTRKWNAYTTRYSSSCTISCSSRRSRLFVASIFMIVVGFTLTVLAAFASSIKQSRPPKFFTSNVFRLVMLLTYDFFNLMDFENHSFHKAS